MDGKYRVELTYEKGKVTFEMSKDELEVHFPEEIAILENSPCSAVSFPDQHGGRLIEKVKD